MEKPLTETSAQSEELIEIAKKNNLILAPFQNRRWDSDFLAVQDLLREKKVNLVKHGSLHSLRSVLNLKLCVQLGQLTEFKSEFNRFRPQPVPNTWKETPGGLNDAIYNLGSHLIDQALVLFGKPERVGGWCYNLRAPEGMDDSVSQGFRCQAIVDRC
jgi:scyllo-inositol 2-dehydrogenase (NADP+)